jgi:hypothetical protein
MSPRTRIPPGKTGVAGVLFTMLGFVAGALGMFGGLALLHAPVLSRDGGMPSSAGTSIEQALRDHLPPSMRDCPPDNVRGDTIARSSYAMVLCTRPGTPSMVEYALIHDKVAMKEIFDVEKSSYLTTTYVRLPSGDCSKQPPGGGTWHSSMGAAGSLHHILGPKKAGEETTVGSMICYISGGHYWIEWYDNDTRIYALASATPENYSSLFEWWEREAGPYHPANMSGNEATETPSM